MERIRLKRADRQHVKRRIVQINSPTPCVGYRMQIFSALFTKVLLGAHGLVHDPNAAAMLPDLANVALNEQSTFIFL